jgi:HEAT repeat protein
LTITRKKVLDLLSSDEPSYSKALKYGSEVLPHLEAIIKTAEPMLASKVTYLAGTIQDKRSLSILMISARSNNPRIRTAAAAACQHLKFHEVNELLDLLKDDQHNGVRKIALRSKNLKYREKQR